MMQWKQLKCPERLGAGERGGDAARAESGATSEFGDLGAGFVFFKENEFTTCSRTESIEEIGTLRPAGSFSKEGLA